MKLTKTKLKQIIKEELQSVLAEKDNTDLGKGPNVDRCGRSLPGKGWINFKRSGKKGYWIYQQNGKVQCGKCWTAMNKPECKNKKPRCPDKKDPACSKTQKQQNGPVEKKPKGQS